MNKKIRSTIKTIAVGFLLLPSFLSPWAVIKSTTTRAASIQPNYSTSEERPFEGNSWYVEGQEDIVNHTGNVSAGSSVFAPRHLSPANENNFSSDYITYDNEDYAMRQFARQTATPGLYDVFTNIRGNRVREMDKLSIVLISDHSASMNETVAGHNRMYYLDQAIKKFTQSLTEIMAREHMSEDIIRIGHLAYGSTVTREERTFVPLGDFSQVQRSRLDAATPSTAPTGNYTFTQAGLREAGAMLNEEGDDRKKIVILMTDGVPTYANAITDGADANSNGQIDIGEVAATTRNNSGNTVGNSTNRNPNREIDLSAAVNGGLTPRNIIGTGTSSTQPYYNNTFPATIYEADRLKNAGVEIHGIGIALQNGTSNSTYQNINIPGFTAAQINTNMERMTSSPYFYLNVYDPAQLGTYLNTTLSRFFKTVSSGQAQIKIGEQFELAENSVSLKYFENQTEQNSSYRAEVGADGKTINVRQLNLGYGEEVQIHHQVHIQTENMDFAPNTWLHISDIGATWFRPTAFSDNLPFAVPSGRAPGTSLELTKHWQDRENADDLRPESVTFELERAKTINAGSWTHGRVSFSGDKHAGSWQLTGLSSLDIGEAKVALPLFNNRGETFDYRVVNEITSGSDYGAQFDGLKVTNYERFNFRLIKSSNAGSPTTGAEFALYDGERQLMTGLSGADGLVTWDNENFRFRLDKSYRLVETKALPGHRLAGPWLIQNTVDNKLTIQPENPADLNSVVDSYFDGSTFVVRLLNEQEVRQIKGEKHWKDDAGQTNFRPESLTIELYRNAVKIDEKTVTPDDEGRWTYDFGYRASFDASGNAYNYEVREVPVAHYEGGKGEGFDLINRFRPSTTEVSLRKIWADSHNLAGWRPENVSVRLLQDGEPYEEISLSGDITAGEWTHTFTNLPEYKNRTEKHVYSVEEVNIPERYRSEIDGFEITNTFVPETVSVNGEKIWQDDNNAAGQRPESIVVKLMRNRLAEGLEPKEIDTRTISAEDNWQFNFDDLPKYDYSGDSPVEIGYLIAEEMDGQSSRLYQSDVELADDGRFKITNRFEPRLLLAVDKIDADFGTGMHDVQFDLEEVEQAGAGYTAVSDGLRVPLISDDEGRLQIDRNPERAFLQPFGAGVQPFGQALSTFTEPELDSGLIELEYGKYYRLRMLPHAEDSLWWAMPNATEDWLIRAPESYADAIAIGSPDIEHELTPGDLVSGIPRMLARIPGDPSGVALSADTSLDTDETGTPVYWFQIHSNLLTNFTIKKLDKQTSEPMQVTFRLAWQYQFVPEANFDSLSTIATSGMQLQTKSPKADLSNLDEPDTWAGATLTTNAVTGQKSLGHMNRGALYILTEDMPADYQPANVVIVVYMDQAQNFHARLADKATFEQTGNLVFVANEDASEFGGLDKDQLMLTFLNQKKTPEDPQDPQTPKDPQDPPTNGEKGDNGDDEENGNNGDKAPNGASPLGNQAAEKGNLPDLGNLALGLLPILGLGLCSLALIAYLRKK